MPARGENRGGLRIQVETADQGDVFDYQNNLGYAAILDMP